MKLYESPSPNARRVHVFMAEKGVELPRVAVDIRGGENLTPDYKAKNPAGRVPVLELDDGTFIGESVAICRYLEALHPEPNLFGSSAKEIGPRSSSEPVSQPAVKTATSNNAQPIFIQDSMCTLLVLHCFIRITL